MADSDHGHIIQRHIFDIEIERRDRAHAIQSELSRIFHQRLVRLIDEVLTEFSPNGEHLSIERLELDLGYLEESFLESELVEGTKRELRRVLSNIIYQLEQGIPVRETTVTKVPEPARKADLLAYFLQHGHMPAQASWDGPDISSLILSLIEEDPDALRTLLVTAIRQPAALARLARQLPEVALQQTIAFLAPHHDLFIMETLTELQKTYTVYFSSSVQATFLVREAVFAYLLREKALAFSREAFLKSVREWLEKRLDLAPAEEIREGGRITPGTEALVMSWVPDPETVPVAIGDAQYKPPKEVDLDVKMDTIRYFFEEGELPWWSKGHSGELRDPVRLMQKVIGSDPGPVRDQLRLWSKQVWGSRRKQLIERLTVNLDRTEFMRIITLLVPDVAGFVETLILALERTISEVAPGRRREFQRWAWPGMLAYVWAKGTAAFEVRAFAHQVIAEIAPQTGVNVDELTEAVAQVATRLGREGQRRFKPLASILSQKPDPDQLVELFPAQPPPEPEDTPSEEQKMETPEVPASETVDQPRDSGIVQSPKEEGAPELQESKQEKEPLEEAPLRTEAPEPQEKEEVPPELKSRTESPEEVTSRLEPETPSEEVTPGEELPPVIEETGETDPETLQQIREEEPEGPEVLPPEKKEKPIPDEKSQLEDPEERKRKDEETYDPVQEDGLIQTPETQPEEEKPSVQEPSVESKEESTDRPITPDEETERPVLDDPAKLERETKDEDRSHLEEEGTEERRESAIEDGESILPETREETEETVQLPESELTGPEADRLIYYLRHGTFPKGHPGARSEADFEVWITRWLKEAPERTAALVRKWVTFEVRQRLVTQLSPRILNLLFEVITREKPELIRYYQVLVSSAARTTGKLKPATVMQHFIFYAQKRLTRFTVYDYVKSLIKYTVRVQAVDYSSVVTVLREGITKSRSPLRKEILTNLEVIEKEIGQLPQKRPGSPRKPTERRAIPMPKVEEGEPIYVLNAGLVLIWPFLSFYFKTLEMLDEDRQFKDQETAFRAVHLLQYLATANSDTPEQYLMLNKVMCGVPLSEPIDAGIQLTEEEMELSGKLFDAVIKQWDKMKNSSHDNLRGSFLIREGKLTRRGDNWVLRVDPKPFDILLDSLPWSLNLVRFSWIPYTIHVEWR